MRRLTYLRSVVACLALITILPGQQASSQDRALSFSCATFPANASAADLAERFGEEHVRTAPVPWGGAEGDYREGTVLFDDDPTARVEIFWRDAAGKRNPDWVSVRGKRSRWRTPEGITIGTDLQTIEKLNRRPFRLVGFGVDGSGTVMSWSGGRLPEQDASGCRLRLRLAADEEKTEHGRSPFFLQLIGLREFSSGHPAMQALKPAVYELFIQYR